MPVIRSPQQNAVVGSDWTWELRVPTVTVPALRELHSLAADHGLGQQRSDGLINLFDAEGDVRTVEDPEAAFEAFRMVPYSSNSSTIRPPSIRSATRTSTPAGSRCRDPTRRILRSVKDLGYLDTYPLDVAVHNEAPESIVRDL